MKFIQFFGVVAVLIAHCSASRSGGFSLDLEARDIQEEGAVSCKNHGVRLTDKVGKCDPGQSRGFFSAHNCKNNGGKYYYCVTKSGGTCTAVRNAVGAENGECFA